MFYFARRRITLQRTVIDVGVGGEEDIDSIRRFIAVFWDISFWEADMIPKVSERVLLDLYVTSYIRHQLELIKSDFVMGVCVFHRLLSVADICNLFYREMICEKRKICSSEASRSSCT